MNAQDRAQGVLAAKVYLAKGKRQYTRGVLRALREAIVGFRKQKPQTME